MLYKIYERMLEARLQRVITIALEQCGFRSGFSTHTLLTRISILINYCKNRNIDLYLIATDFK